MRQRPSASCLHYGTGNKACFSPSLTWSSISASSGAADTAAFLESDRRCILSAVPKNNASFPAGFSILRRFSAVLKETDTARPKLHAVYLFYKSLYKNALICFFANERVSLYNNKPRAMPVEKGNAYEESRRSGSLPCVRGGVKIFDFDGGVEKSAQSNPTISRMLNSSLYTREPKKLHSTAKKIGSGAQMQSQ